MAMVSSDQNSEEEEEEEEEDDDYMKLRKIPGIKFKPTDEMLADYYLRKKAAGRDDGICKHIRKEDIYEYQPSELSSLAYDFGDGNKRMYFVTTLKTINRKGTNVDRSTRKDGRKIGFWKITAKISYVEKDGRKIASKTPLAYHINKTSDKPEKSQWLMTEYRLIEDQSNEESKRLALCVIYLHGAESGKGVREEKNEQSSVYEKGEGSNSKAIATEAASSSLPPTENSNHQDTMESLVSFPIANSDQNMLAMGSQHTLERWAPIANSDQNMPAMGSQQTLERWASIANSDQNMPVMGSQYTLESSTPIANSDHILPVMRSQYTLESSAPIANSDQNMPVMRSQYTLESSAPIANSDQNMPVMGSQYAFERWAPIANSDQNMPMMESQYTLESSAPIANSDQNMPVMGSQDSNNPYQNMPYPVMGSQSSNFVQNIPNQVMGLHGATDSNVELPLETIADVEQWLLRTEDNCGYQTWERIRF